MLGAGGCLLLSAPHFAMSAEQPSQECSHLASADLTTPMLGLCMQARNNKAPTTTAGALCTTFATPDAGNVAWKVGQDGPLFAFFDADCFFLALFWAALTFLAGDDFSSADLFLFVPLEPAARGAFTGDLYMAQSLRLRHTDSRATWHGVVNQDQVGHDCSRIKLPGRGNCRCIQAEELT